MFGEGSDLTQRWSVSVTSFCKPWDCFESHSVLLSFHADLVEFHSSVFKLKMWLSSHMRDKIPALSCPQSKMGGLSGHASDTSCSLGGLYSEGSRRHIAAMESEEIWSIDFSGVGTFLQLEEETETILDISLLLPNCNQFCVRWGQSCIWLLVI